MAIRDAFPHIGDASFTVDVNRQCADYNEVFKVAMQAGGKQFLLDMLSADAVPPPTPTEKSSVLDQIKASSENKSVQVTVNMGDAILLFDDFIVKCSMMDEEYLNDPDYHADCDFAAKRYDQDKAAQKDAPEKLKNKGGSEL